MSSNKAYCTDDKDGCRASVEGICSGGCYRCGEIAECSDGSCPEGNGACHRCGLRCGDREKKSDCGGGRVKKKGHRITKNGTERVKKESGSNQDRKDPCEIEDFVTVSLVGNPNVGKSTLFNSLTGLNQHTGNWAGKTVAVAEGRVRGARRDMYLVDLPGTYSLLANSPEEEVTVESLMLCGQDVCVVVIDGSAPLRGLGLCLQVMELGLPFLLCVNLKDEAKRRGVRVDIEGLSAALGVPVVETSASDKRDVRRLLSAIEALADNACGGAGLEIEKSSKIDGATVKARCTELCPPLPGQAEEAIGSLAQEILYTISENPHTDIDCGIAHGSCDAVCRQGGEALSEDGSEPIDTEKVLREGGEAQVDSTAFPSGKVDILTEGGARLISTVLFTNRDSGARLLGCLICGVNAGERVENLLRIRDGLWEKLLIWGAGGTVLADAVYGRYSDGAARLAELYVSGGGRTMSGVWDRLFTGRISAPIMLCIMLIGVLYITVELANYPSELLSLGFGYLGERMYSLLLYLELPPFAIGLIYDGIYVTLARIVSVMLPPMAIFFPLFTLLEEVGVLPRIAYDLDAPLSCAGGCGKQALTMCMGLGCNAAGVVGCRIIESHKERTLAILTNSLMPCNGRFPAIILLAGLYLSAGAAGALGSAAVLFTVVLIGVGATMLLTFVLSRAAFAREESFFAMEIPPFRKPRIGSVLVRSFIDRTLVMLCRAVAVAIPAGAVIWLLSDVRVGDVSIFVHICSFLDPVGRVMGLDGVTLTGFILGMPANEIVLPIVASGYSAVYGIEAGGALSAAGIGEALSLAGWTPVRAVCFILFSLMHFPCATTLFTIYKETRSRRLTLLSALAPTALGFLCCITVNLIARLFS